MRNLALWASVMSLAAAFSLSAFAQGNTVAPPVPKSKSVATGRGVTRDARDNKAVATVRIDGGVIMISDGGAFLSAIPDQAVASGERLMVAKESAATVIYNDGCEQKFDKVGIYKIEPNCKMPVAFFGGVSPALLIGTSLVGGAALANVIDDDDCGCKCPISR